MILAAGITTVVVKNSADRSLVKLPPDPAAEESFRLESAEHLSQSKQWALAFIMFAEDHGNQLPNDFAQLKKYVQDLSDSNWEIVSGGNMNRFVNPSETSRTILLREKKARPSPAGPFVKIYAFVDGHAEMISSPDKDFAALEKERGFVARPAKD